PRAIDIHRTLAASFTEDLAYAKAEQAIERALAIDPQDPESLRIAAELAAQQGDLTKADELLQKALAGNPHRQKTLALQVFLLCLQGSAPDPTRFETLLKHLDKIAEWKETPSAIEAIIVELAKRNPRPGYFLDELGRLFETQRKFAHAEKCYRQAIASMPQLARPKTELGRLLFQTGRVAEAKELLDDAFKADPYHVRVSNLRKVMRVLDDYAATTTPHFVIRADAQLDAVLARYMAEYLEEIYPQITGEYGYEPPQRTQIEIYNKAKGLAGHQWFSARMVGLPWIQTIGASTGLIVALTSPSATEEPFNWARVLKHEFIHVVTLQQTDFNIPHWYTEALATRSEGYPMPMEWNRLLQRRVATNNLRNLDNLHLGFQKAESRDDWNFAYCQSVLYSDYFEQRFGKESLARLLEAYRTTRSTSVAVQQAFQIDKADLEAGYVKFLQERATRLATAGTLPELDVAQARKDYADRPDDPDAQAAYAEWQMRQNKFAQAESLARKVLDLTPKHIRAALVVSRCQLQRDDAEGAEETLSNAWDADQPQPQLSAVLGQVRLKLDSAEGALTVFTAARDKFPDDPQWSRGIAGAAGALGQGPVRLAALERVAAIDPDDVKARKILAEEAFKDGDGPRTVRFAKLAMQIDVLDAEIHRLLARGFRIEKNDAGALAEWEVTCQLQPGKPDDEVEWARAL
ncbi:MAG TPA: tetratricopeptide repeat protein, partial [Planctomycetaceae bacterium]|nr:tetratricopeptide repeat protein [Planctomycetaceae bacterium]